MKSTLEYRRQRAVIVAHELKKLFPKATMALQYNNDWQLCVAVVLSAQTTDKQVNVVTETLFKKYPDHTDYVDLNIDVLQKEIQSIGLYRNKAKNIIAAANLLEKKFSGQFPKTMEEMLLFPDVGRKTANILLSIMHDVVAGIAVDTHVKRLSNLFGLTDHSDPKKIEQDLLNILPKEEWKYFTYRMIEYGRMYSPARKKDHSEDRVLLALAHLD